MSRHAGGTSPGSLPASTVRFVTPEELRSAVERGEVDTVMVAFTDAYGRLLGKRFDAGFFCDSVLDAGTHACDYLLTVDMEMEPVPGYRVASWDLGYGDVHLVPDLATLRLAAWADQTALVLCDVVDEAAGELVEVAPRSVLRRQLERLDAAGYRAAAASELEFFILDETYRGAADKGYRDLRASGWYVEDYHLLSGARAESYLRQARLALSASEIPVEGSKGEWGSGQHELNVRHCEPLAMADRHTIMKHAMKELADTLGVSVTFMAKPLADGAGSSGHLHVSLWDPVSETNLFATGGGESDLFRWFLGGWIAHVDDFMVCYAPTINSYKRYAASSWAPTTAAWSRDNRTAGFRVVGHGPSLRIECRIPGADCNPYLAYAATIASGLAGIEHQIEPPASLDGDAYRSDAAGVIPTLEHAVATFSASTVARHAFGDAVVDHYSHFHRVEVDAYHRAVTDWERARYFERI
jgi:glutamine synthetase